MTLTLTADEVDLLREWPRFAEACIVSPDGSRRIRESCASGGGFGRNYEINGGRLIGTWCRYEVVETFGPDARPDLVGRPARLHFNPPHREVSITLSRLQKWADQLPGTFRERAIVLYHPKTRDLDALHRVTLEALDLQGRRDLEQARAEWFTEPPSSAATPTSPHCSADDHAACWAGHERPPNCVCWRDLKNRRISPRGIVATFRPGWSPHTRNTSARIVAPVEHYTCGCDCHTVGFAGQQLDLFQAVS
ncbi:hypothetical protein [Gordonia sp. SCSIO 19800]|uniref:hypothetical protein n=1 Tax=Gordonia sp. SCSIO 19800 TaxID=2826926 RepID=UPI001B817549|nr:hypothetical protein [Gordonia sp. SCSIO 19800]MBR7191696.1 hypothetical protein [Gordonia sp. SCSIO 19800]